MPLANNRFGDMLNIELRHEQLFFIKGNEVLDDIGYSEKGTRFNEADFGKSIKTLEDLRNAGYWLTGPVYQPKVMREALKELDDGYYYSFFSNQCQDWADRLRRKADTIQKAWGLPKGEVLNGLSAEKKWELTEVRTVPPTEPASLGMGVVAILLGVAAILAPMFFGRNFAYLMGLFFAASGVSHTVYALKGKDIRAAVPIFISAFLYLVGGLFILVNETIAVVAASAGIAATLGFQGLSSVGMALFSRPIRNWVATLVTGLIMVACALLVFLHWPDSGSRFLGRLVGFCLISGGLSTVILSQRTRSEAG